MPSIPYRETRALPIVWLALAVHFRDGDVAMVNAGLHRFDRALSVKGLGNEWVDLELAKNQTILGGGYFRHDGNAISSPASCCGGCMPLTAPYHLERSGFIYRWRPIFSVS